MDETSLAQARWYRLFLVAVGTVRVDEKRLSEQCIYVAQWREGEAGEWHTYEKSQGTWTQAYAALEKHAKPSDLRARYVGTF